MIELVFELVLWAVGIWVGLWALVGFGASVWAWCRLSNAYVAAMQENRYHAESSRREPDTPP